jgi:uncharacterized protein YciI
MHHFPFNALEPFTDAEYPPAPDGTQGGPPQRARRCADTVAGDSCEGAMPAVRYVLFYESADDVTSKAPPHFPAHRERLEDFHARGTLLLVGTFGDPQEEGSMAIFTNREAAEEFAKGDPFVLNGVVARWHIREWDEVLGED